MDKAARKRIGILLVSEDIGVIYYLLSIVKSINFLNDVEKPEILLLYDERCEKFADLFSCEYLKTCKIEYNKNKKLKFLQSAFLRKNLFTKFILKQYKLNGLFPLMDSPVRSLHTATTIASWIPDFQHKFYPEFFSKGNLFMREARFKNIIDKSDALVLSSNNSYSHLKKFYKVKEDKIKVHVIPFVSLIQDFVLPEYTELATRYNISTPYFLVSNQFYAHKNHIVVLKAIKELKKSYADFTVYFTGKTEDYRNPLFYETLIKYIKENDLKNQAIILGIIPREDQLGLLKNSLAVIQPSKFEGWSTVIEDAKTLQKQVICSNIDVHVEQMGENAFYFNPDLAEELSKLMNLFVKGKGSSKPVFKNYNERVKTFASTFVNIFE
jgi:glycosyltransferase involved in cell wall biosynthesis